MKKISLILLMIVVSISTVFAQKSKDRKALFNSPSNYEVTTIKTGTDGTKFVKVWGYGKKVDQAIVQAKKNAVAACIFRGLPASGDGTAMATPALSSDVNLLQTKAAYFGEFFETAGTYIQFINLTTDGVPSGQDRLEVKGGYKVAIYAQIMFDNLRKKLEQDGILRKLSTGF